MEQFLAQCDAAVLKGNRPRAIELATEAVKQGMDPLTIIENGFGRGIEKAGELWESGEYFLPELAFSAEAMKAAMEIFKPALLASKENAPSRGTVVIGTIQGDIHDIGKTLVATMLAANGYEVIDLGADVPYDRFIETAAQQDSAIICMSALLTTTMPGQGEVIKRVQERGLQKKVKVVIGGAPANESWAEEIGADGYADNAVAAVQVVNGLA